VEVVVDIDVASFQTRKERASKTSVKVCAPCTNYFRK
jgi:hypothetical protein